MIVWTVSTTTIIWKKISHYDLVVLGSSEVLLYDQWDTIYSPLKEYVRRRVIDADSSDDDDDEVFDADSSDEEDDA